MLNLYRNILTEIFLVQTDTTVGFLSKDKEALFKIKPRDKSQSFLMELSSLAELKKLTRVYNKHKHMVRRARNVSFIYKKDAFRVVKDELHLNFLRKYKRMYSTSANEHKKSFDRTYAFNNVDIICEDSRGLVEREPSSLYKLYKKKFLRLR